MTRTPLPLAPDVAAAADHGQYCPKLCSHACPVLRATGRPDAVPWSFHRTVADLAQQRLSPADAAGRLVACTGCRSCAGACEVAGQDVPGQVRAGRAAVHAAGRSLPGVAAAVAAVDEGDSPYGVELPRGLGAAHADVVLVAGCRDTSATVTAAVRLLAAAGQVSAVVVPEGCCGSVLADVGAVVAAAAAREALVERLPVTMPVLLLDPHCAASVAPDVAAEPDDAAELVAAGDTGAGTGRRVRHLVDHLAWLVEDGRLALEARRELVRWHEPCILRDTPAAGRGAALLAAIGALVELPGEPHHGCSGGGLGLPLLDETAAAATAVDRVEGLDGAGPLVSACAGAVTSLATADDESIHLVTVLASLLDDRPESVA